MIKKITIIALLLFLTGCYNYNELNDLAIVIAMGIDKIDNEYLVSLEIINTQKEDKTDTSTISNFSIYQAKGNTIEEAVKNISYICPKKIYLSHLEIIIYGEKLAKSGIKSSLDYFARNIEIRGNTIMLVAKNSKASDILKTITPINTINAQNIVSLVKNVNNSLGTSIYVTFDDILSNYLNKNKEIIMPTIIIDEKNNNILKLNDTAIFKNDKLISFLNKENTLGYNILTNNIHEAIINYQNKNYYISVLINKIKTEITTKDNLNVDIFIKASGNITEVNSNINLEDEQVINEINKMIASKIKKIVKSSLSLITSINSDILGILDNYYKNNHNAYKEINQKDYLKKIQYHINVEVNLINKGNILRVIENEK